MVLRVAAAVIATILPNFGFLLTEWIGLKLYGGNWFFGLVRPPWITDTVHDVLTPTWALANFMLGYSSYVVWNSAKRGSRLPITSYVLLLLLFWTHYPVYLTSRSLISGFIVISLAMVASVATFVLFSKVSTMADVLMSLFMILLAHECYYSFWLLKNNPPEIALQNSIDHVVKGQTPAEPVISMPEGNESNNPLSQHEAPSDASKSKRK